MFLIPRLKNLLPQSLRNFLKYRWIDYNLSRKFFTNQKELNQYKQEVFESGLIEEISTQLDSFKENLRGKTSRGNRYGLGIIPFQNSIYLYAIIRKLKPQIIVETGVCNGVSTAFFLLALQKNSSGKLYSIDFPEVQGIIYENKTFWKGKTGEVIPKNKQPGWLIPDNLKDRWELILGKSQEKLPALLQQLETIDFFIHDSEHSYQCMSFEYNLAYTALRTGGVLMSDDLTWNNAFQDFSQEKNKPILYIGSNIGFWVK